MKAPTRRGRPPSAKTLGARQREEWLNNPPAHITRLTEAEKAELDERFEHDERIRQEILKDFKHGRTTPNSHAYEMASLGDEALYGFEDQVFQRDAVYRDRADAYRRGGSRAVHNNSLSRAAEVCRNFKPMLDRVEPRGQLSLTHASELMRRLWNQYHNKGDPPSARTLRTWIRQASPFPEHRVGKVSSRNKSPP